MKLTHATIAIVSLGIILLVASFAWSAIIPNEAVWSEAQAVAYQQASITYHNDTFDESLSKAELQASEEAYETLRSRLDDAVMTKDAIPRYLRIGGLSAVGFGILLLVVQRSREP